MAVEAVLLGIAQDGGVPHAGCYCATCRQARADPSKGGQWVACLGLADYAAGKSWLIDATPHFAGQLHALNTLAPGCALAGVVLTHAHVGHYVGMYNFFEEILATRKLPVYASPQMGRFLETNAPWSQLVAQGNIQLCPLNLNGQTRLSEDLRLTAYPVPHRDELSDTQAFVVHGPARSLFYCPDIDDWGRWDRDARAVVSGVDVALVDGTFFSPGELPNRDLSQIPHPMVTDTAARLAGLGSQIYLIHLNHSNPLLAPGPERDWLAKQGIGVGAFGQRWML